jgi:putative phage-type endonuclease
MDKRTSFGVDSSEMKTFERIPYKTELEWLNLRCLGGSNASAILGQNPYCTNLELWQEMVGIKPRPEIDNPFVRYGKVVEHPLRKIFEMDYIGLLKISYTNEVLRRIDKPYLTASLDGEIEVLQDFRFTSYWKPHYKQTEEEIAPEPILLTKGMKGVLEIKTTEVLSSMHKEKWHNSIPQNYYIQTLHYLNVTNYDFVILVAQLKFVDRNGVMTKETRQYGYLRNGREADLLYLENEVDKFWSYVERKEEPPLLINF